MSPSRVTVRPARPEDRDAIVHICLMTANEGKSAAPLVTIPELPALVWALPYLELPTGFGFVMVEESTGEGEDIAQPDNLSNNTDTDTSKSPLQAREKIVGYIVGTSNTEAYELAAEKQWWPKLRERYLRPDESESDADADGLTPRDRHYLRLIQSGTHAPSDALAFSGATIHINILPEHQRCGWGRRLLHVAVNELQKSGSDGLWVGSNGVEGRRFYSKVGFKPLQEQDIKFMGLRFEDFVAPQTPLAHYLQ
ncbi:hypothetical protein EW145_g3776 [Phellinidium pouzarii]|uniref:N-acetyltransferase domain-containing protein n=1 Tax=Phellinidium pouzarii TaxID=167371 RepID=A0A4S4L7S5_9AGAM|nr:hypothetical protein EW145_g3776 [Phellinidium pouzarii]